MKRLFLYASTMLLFFSCMQPMDSARKYYYYGKSVVNGSNNDDNQQSGGSTGEDIPETVSVSEDEDPFNPKNGEWNDINYNFDGNKLKTWFFHVNFDDNTVPSYTFYTPDSSEGTWALSNEQKNEKKSYPKRTYKANSSITVSSVAVCRYDGKNPLVGHSRPYNAPGGRMERFYFYRLTGKTAGLDLDQHLIAVDSYSKLIFAYGKIVKTTTILSNIMPTGFDALDGFESDRGETKGEKRPFYQYDPIGFVKESGEVVLYEEYRSEMGNSSTGQTKYFPQVHDKNRPIAKYVDSNTPGLSPYFTKENAVSANSFADIVSSKVCQLRNEVDYSYTHKNGQIVYVSKGNGFILDTWSFDSTGKNLELRRVDSSNGKIAVTTETYIFEEGQTITDEKQATYKSGGQSVTIRFDGGVLFKDGIKVGVVNYSDSGPDFLLRVKGATFVSADGKVSYRFSDDGAKVSISGRPKNNGDYWYDPDVNNTGEGISYSSSSTWGRMFLKNNDYTIEMDIGGGNYYPANRNYGGVNESDPMLQSFFTEVHGKVYQMRETVQHTKAGAINGWIFNTYQFSADGRTMTLIITDGTDYVEKTSVKTYTFDSIKNLSTAKYKDASTGTIHTIQIDGTNIKKDGVVAGTFGYFDPGPHWLMRVAGWTFETGDTVYEFSVDGLSLTIKYLGFPNWYTPIKSVNSYTREWEGDSTSILETKYGGIWLRLQDESGSGSGTGDVSAKPGTNRYIRAKQTAYGKAGATWEYEAERKVKN